MNCPDSQYFNPDHVDGCLGPGGGLTLPLPPTPPPPTLPTTLPPPVFGNPSPLITHIGTPILPGQDSGGFISKRSYTVNGEQQPAIELSEATVMVDHEGNSNEEDSDIQWPSWQNNFYSSLSDYRLEFALSWFVGLIHVIFYIPSIHLYVNVVHYTLILGYFIEFSEYKSRVDNKATTKDETWHLNTKQMIFTRLSREEEECVHAE